MADMGDKTELPTGRRLSEARSEGNVARSQDLAAAVDLLGAFILLLTFGGALARAMFIILRRTLEDQSQVSLSALTPLIKNMLVQTAVATLPMLGLMCLIAAISYISQFGILWNIAALRPKWERLNPMGGMGRLFNKASAAKTGVNTAKLALVCWIGYVYLRSCTNKLIALPMLSAIGGWMVIGRMAIELAAWLFVIMLIMGIADYLYQRHKHTQDLRMTREEVKDERRSMEGDPKVKGKRMKMALNIARQRVAAAVPKAHVIVTNPTHFSVAIQYDQAKMKAPRVIAKGADEIAFTIRHLARIHKVPVVERPPLARALYKHTNVGQEIRPEYYEAVAEVLAYVYRLEREAVAKKAALAAA